LRDSLVEGGTFLFGPRMFWVLCLHVHVHSIIIFVVRWATKSSPPAWQETVSLYAVGTVERLFAVGSFRRTRKLYRQYLVQVSRLFEAYLWCSKPKHMPHLSRLMAGFSRRTSGILSKAVNSKFEKEKSFLLISQLFRNSIKQSRFW